MGRMWVEREPPELLIGLGSFISAAAGALGWYRSGWVAGLFAFFAAGLVASSLIQLIWYLVAAVPLPDDVCSARDEVVRLFRRSNPNARIEHVGVRAVDPERAVISVRYQPAGRTVIEPSPIRYFAVGRLGTFAVSELNAEEWLPRGYK